MREKKLLLVISGGIAAYKVLELIRRLRERHIRVMPVMTDAAAKFVTPLSVSALTGERLYTSLFDLTDEVEMGHIQLSRSADLIVVAPATADILSRMASGRADDLASTILLATDKPVLVVPAMNARMWDHPATQRNVATLREDGIHFVGPNEGHMACGEFGLGRFSEVPEIITAIEAKLSNNTRDLSGQHMIVTSGPTREAIDPVRYMSNHSSGKQGHAVAAALSARGADVTLISGPVTIPDPAGVTTLRADTACAMENAVLDAFPADAVICAAAVADWRMDRSARRKLKKSHTGPLDIKLLENPDILAMVSQHTKHRPSLVVGFAAETTNVIKHAQAKRARKGCDWLLANDVGIGTGVFGGDQNTIHFITAKTVETWPTQSKIAVASQLAQRVVEYFKA